MPKTAFVLVMALAMGLALVTTAGAICGDTKVECWAKNPNSGEHNVKAGLITVDACYDAGEMSCGPCASICSLTSVCNSAYPDDCQGNCWTYWYGTKSHAWRSCGPTGWRP